MASNDMRVQQTIDIYRETREGLDLISQTYELGIRNNPYEKTYEQAIEARAEEAVTLALNGGVFLSPVRDVTNEIPEWFTADAKYRLGNAAYTLFCKRQDESVNNILGGLNLTATSITAREFGAISRSTAGVVESGGHMPKQVTAPFFKADANVGDIILRQEATDDTLDIHERSYRKSRPDSYKYVYWIVSLFKGQTQSATLEIVEGS